LFEQVLGGLVGGHSFGDGVGLFLVLVARTSDTPVELHAVPLLDDMGGFMSRESHIRVRAEAHMIACGVGGRTQLAVGLFRGASNPGPGAANVVAAKR
jgi:hypothetical protein